MKFAGHRNPRTLVGHYLDDMSNVDGAAAFLGGEARRDIPQDFRSASLKRNPDLLHSLPAKEEEELERSEDYIALSKQVDAFSQIKNIDSTKESCNGSRAQLDNLYYQRRKLREQAVQKYLRSQKRIYNQTVAHETDWRKSYFDRVIAPMAPERARLAKTLGLSVPLRSSEGISALEDLLTLLTRHDYIPYQKAQEPIQGRCPVSSCSRDMERHVRKRSVESSITKSIN